MSPLPDPAHTALASRIAQDVHAATLRWLRTGDAAAFEALEGLVPTQAVAEARELLDEDDDPPPRVA